MAEAFTPKLEDISWRRVGNESDRTNERIGNAIRMQKLGRRVLTASELSKHRKEVHRIKVEGLESSLGKRKDTLRAAKAELKYAKRGEKSLSRSQRKANLSEEVNAQRATLMTERGLESRKAKGIGERLVYRGVNKEAKLRAQAVITARERAAANEKVTSRAKVDVAKSRVKQTRNALSASRARLSGRGTGFAASYRDSARSREERLASLDASAKERQDRKFEDSVVSTIYTKKREAEGDHRVSKNIGEHVTPDEVIQPSGERVPIGAK